VIVGYQDLESPDIWSENVRCSSKIKSTCTSSGVSCSERCVMYFTKLLFKSDKKKLNFRRVESEKIGSHQGRDLL